MTPTTPSGCRMRKVLPGRKAGDVGNRRTRIQAARLRNVDRVAATSGQNLRQLGFMPGSVRKVGRNRRLDGVLVSEDQGEQAFQTIPPAAGVGDHIRLESRPLALKKPVQFGNVESGGHHRGFARRAQESVSFLVPHRRHADRNRSGTGVPSRVVGPTGGNARATALFPVSVAGVILFPPKSFPAK